MAQIIMVWCTGGYPNGSDCNGMMYWWLASSSALQWDCWFYRRIPILRPPMRLVVLWENAHPPPSNETGGFIGEFPSSPLQWDWWFYRRMPVHHPAMRLVVLWENAHPPPCNETGGSIGECPSSALQWDWCFYRRMPILRPPMRLVVLWENAHPPPCNETGGSIGECQGVWELTTKCKWLIMLLECMIGRSKCTIQWPRRVCSAVSFHTPGQSHFEMDGWLLLGEFDNFFVIYFSTLSFASLHLWILVKDVI